MPQTVAPETGFSRAERIAADHPVSKHERWRRNLEAKSLYNKQNAESHSRTALVLGGGAPNMTLMAGALAAFDECEECGNITFDVVSTSGAGGLAGLLWLAPKGRSRGEALRSVIDMSVADLIFQFFPLNYFPVNYKVFNKPGYLADLWRDLTNLPWFTAMIPPSPRSEPGALFVDGLELILASLSPWWLTPWSSGLCARAPFVERIVDFESIRNIEPHFYLNAYNVTKERMDNFGKHDITPDHFRAALAFPFIYGPYRLNNGDLYYEGAVRDCLNFKDLVEKHPGLETIVVFDVLGSDALIRAPRSLYDSWLLSMVIPLVKTAEDNLDLFEHKHNKGRVRVRKVEFPIPPADLPEVLDWSRSNAARLFEIGYDAGRRFCEQHGDELRRPPAVVPTPRTRAAHEMSRLRRRDKRRK
jgi:NTE family protein